MEAEAPGIAPPREGVVLTPAAVRRLAIAVVLVAAAFAQVPGRTVADTKLDLTQDPWRFLGRALHLWDPAGASGQLQNQAFGYLWPMGPFFGVAHSLGISPWATQRLWWSLLLLLAFFGLDRLATAMRIGTPTSRLVAAVAYALSPRIVSELGAVSAEVWPMALTPWVLLPLVRGSREGSERRAAAGSAVAFLCVGAVNAAATGVVLVLPVWWLLTRTAGPRRNRLAGWWVLLVAAASLWWLLPLLLLGGYAPPFLDWIESAAVTTWPASPANAIRGVTAWVAYLGGAWPAGSSLVTSPLLILQSGVLAGLGAGGLAWRRIPERTFLVGGALGGLLLLTVWHTGPLESPLAPSLQHSLDGALAPLRNVHKFDPVLRVPLMLGLAHLLGTVRLRPVRGLPVTRYGVQAVAALAVLSMSVPFFAGRIAPQGPFVAIPSYWQAAATWLGEHAEGRTLVVPGAPHSASLWGTTADEPMQVVAQGAWAVRDAVPLSSAGNIRLLDSIEERLASGRGGDGLAQLLANAGISHVLARNDLDQAQTGSTRPLVVHAALSSAPGLDRVADFGPLVGTASGGGLSVDAGLDPPLPSIEVYAVDPYPAMVTRWAASAVSRISGGPENLLPLEDSGQLGSAPTVLESDAVGPLTGPPDVVTDGYRRREMAFGRVGDGSTSQTLSAQEPYVASRPVHDYWPVPPDGTQTVVRYDGIVGVTASSSGASASAFQHRSRGNGPWSALDGDPATAWWTGNVGGAVGQWIQVDLGRRAELDHLDLRLAPGSVGVQHVRVDVSRGAAPGSTSLLVQPGWTGVQRLELGRVLSGSRLRVTVTQLQPGNDPRALGLSELGIPGTTPTRTYVVPQAGSEGTTYAFGVSQDGRGSCLFLDERPVCAAPLPRPGEEDDSLDRTFTSTTSWQGTVSAQALPSPGTAVNRLLLPLGDAIIATASSSEFPDPAVRPQAAVDDDPDTSWVAGALDQTPTLRLQWPHPRTVSGIQLETNAALAASHATRLRMTFSDGAVVESAVDADGGVSFPPVTTSAVQLAVLSTDHRQSVDPVTGWRTYLPVGVSEVQVAGADDLRKPLDLSSATALACGFGPPLTIDGQAMPTRADGTLRDVVELRPMRVTVCGGAADALRLTAGVHRVTLGRSPAAQPWSLTLTPAQAGASSSSPPAVGVLGWADTRRVLDVPAAADDTVVAVAENANAGWSAALGDRRLHPVRLDGWSQGYVVPAGLGGRLVLTYSPDRPYRAGLLLGLLLALLVIALAVVPGRSSRAGLRERAMGTDVVLVVGGLALVVLAGWFGAAAGLLALAVVRRDRRLLAPAAGGLVVASALLVAWRPFPQADALHRSALPQLLVVAAAALLVAALADEARVRALLRPRWVSRRPGVDASGSAPRPPAS